MTQIAIYDKENKDISIIDIEHKYAYYIYVDGCDYMRAGAFGPQTDYNGDEYVRYLIIYASDIPKYKWNRYYSPELQAEALKLNRKLIGVAPITWPYVIIILISLIYVFYRLATL